MEQLLAGAGLDLLDLCRGKYGRVADIGAADGDLAFFLEELGFSVDAVDNDYTNFNKLEGVRILKNALNSPVTIRSIDLDSRSHPFPERYDAVFLLGVLYHLKNPFFILERLAHVTRYCFLSSRIARQAADGLPLSKHPLAYLLAPEECNNDSTNFWIFSEEGLRRLIHRTGWSILAFTTIGDTNNSMPADPHHDERAICLLKSDAVFELDRGRRARVECVAPGAAPALRVRARARAASAAGRRGARQSSQLRALLRRAPNDPLIRYVSPLGFARQPLAMPNDPLVSTIDPATTLPYEWQFGAVHVDRALDFSSGSASVLVGTIDTGAADVPDLAGKIDSRLTVSTRRYLGNRSGQ